MFPSDRMRKIICPDEDNGCWRPHCPYYHERRSPLWRRRRPKPWLEEGSPMMTLFDSSAQCPKPKTSITLPPKSSSNGPRIPSTAPPRNIPLIGEMYKPPVLQSNDPVYPIHPAYLRPSTSTTSGLPKDYRSGVKKELHGAHGTQQDFHGAHQHQSSSLEFGGYNGYVAPSFAPPEQDTMYTGYISSSLPPISYRPPSAPPISPPLTEQTETTVPVATTVSQGSNENTVGTSGGSTSLPLRSVKKEVVEEEEEEVQLLAVVKRERESPDPEAAPPIKKKKNVLDLPLPKGLKPSSSTPALSSLPPLSNGENPSHRVMSYVAEVDRLSKEIEALEKYTELVAKRDNLLEKVEQSKSARVSVDGLISPTSLPTTSVGSPEDEEMEEYTPEVVPKIIKQERDKDKPRKLKKKPAIEEDEGCGYIPTPIEELKKEKEEEERRKEERDHRKKKQREDEEVRKKEKEALKRKEREEEESRERRRREKEKKLEKEKKREKALKESRRETEKSEKRGSSDSRTAIDNLFGDDDAAMMFDDEDFMPPKPKKLQDIEIVDAPKRKEKPLDPLTAKRLAEKKLAGVQKEVKLTSDQLAVARSRIAKPGAAARVASAESSTSGLFKKRMNPQAQLAERMAKAEKEREETLEKAKREKAAMVQRRLTEGEKYAEMGKVRAATVAKGNARTTHAKQVPSTSSSSAPKPRLLDPTDAKIPPVSRNIYLAKIFEAYKMFMNPVDAADMASQEEKGLKDKSKNRNGYQVACINAIKRIRDVTAEKSGQKHTVSHLAVMAGKHVGDISIGVNRAKKAAASGQLTEEEFYNELKEKFLLTTEQLRDNSFPLWENSQHTMVEIKEPEMDKGKGRKRFADDKDFARICSRCGKEFRLHPKGEVILTDCVYHFGKQWKKKENNWESRFNCCEGDSTSLGCCVAKSHVSETLRKSDLTLFRELPKPRSSRDERSKKVYALDCEMVYTVWGPALARVSVVDMKDDLTLDLIVKPPHPLLDANSRFSGLTMDVVNNATADIEEAYDRLSEYMNSETVLIGHSLESDLKTLHIVHHNVVDTSVVYPHKMGPPYKKALRTLAGDILKKIIQEDESGHDSKEDSSACMQLMLHKVRTGL